MTDVRKIIAKVSMYMKAQIPKRSCQSNVTVRVESVQMSRNVKECYRWIGSKSPCEVSDLLSGTE